MDYILAIDEGTTGVRALLVDARSEVVASAYEELTAAYPKPGWVELDAEAIWQATLRVLIAISPPETGWDRVGDTYSTIGEIGSLTLRIDQLQTMTDRGEVGHLVVVGRGAVSGCGCELDQAAASLR